MGKRKISTLAVLFSSFAALCAAENAVAAKRIARFDGRGINKATTGFVNFSGNAMVPSSCTLMIRNPSAYDQTYEVIYTVASTDEPVNTGTGAATLISPAGPTITGTLSSNQEIVIMWEFLPAVTSVANYTQSLQCSGSIIATDVTPSTRGYLVGSATLTTFQQAMSIASGNAQALKNSSPIVQQNPITVGEGAPF